jgi:hypothetical protein
MRIFFNAALATELSTTEDTEDTEEQPYGILLRVLRVLRGGELPSLS